MSGWRIPDEPEAPAKPTLHAEAAGLYQQAVIEVLGSLLAGEGRLLGRKVAIAWPDGPPPDWSENAVQALARKWKRDARSGLNHWTETAKAAAAADRNDAITEALILSGMFAMERGEDGKDRLVPR